MLFTGIEKDVLQQVQDELNTKWVEVHAPHSEEIGLEEYRERMQYGFLGSLDVLISRIDESGSLDTDAVRQDRENEPGFNPSTYQEAVLQMVRHWPDISLLIQSIG